MTQCPFHVGDAVRFKPTDDDLGRLPPISLYGIVPNQVGNITRIEKGRYIYIAGMPDGMGLDREMFQHERKDAP